MTRRRRSGLSRRALLGGLGAGGLLVPFLPVLDRELGAHHEVPKRLLLVFTANGTIREHWLPSGGETDFSFGSILAPLESHRDDLIIVDGLEVVRKGPGDGHQKGMGLLWTGNELLPGTEFEGGGESGTVGWGGGISVDQTVAEAIGQQTAFSSLEFGVQTRDATVWSRMSYAGANQPIAPEDDPYAMFDRLFSDFGQDQAELERIRAERRSVIDAVKADLDGLSGKMSSDDQHKLDAHLEGIRAIERRLGLDKEYGEACEVPTIDGNIDINNNDSFPEVGRIQTDLLVMALACDLSRVASLQWSKAVSGTRFSWLGINDGHHDLSHEGDSNQSAQDNLTQINIWFSEQFAYLLDALAAVPEGDGTMLDNTVVVWGNELAKGNSHSNHPVPFVLAGGGLRTGRFLEYDRVPHNRLLVSICHAMGLTDVTTFGNIDEASGPLPGLA